MSSLVRTSHASVAYPSCSFCGGSAINSKSSPKRKVALCQVSLYTSVSDSFITWYKKQEEPKGMLWIHSCCVRRGQDSNVELISRGCRGRCSYTLKFATPSASEEWYRLLKLESRKTPSSFGEELSSECNNDGSLGDLTSLDAMLTDISPLSSITELSAYSESDENNSDDGSIVSTNPSVPETSSKSKKRKSKMKVKSVFGNPLQSIGRSKKTTHSTLNNTVSVGTVQVAPLDSITSQSTPDLMDPWVRWSWPLKA